MTNKEPDFHKVCGEWLGDENIRPVDLKELLLSPYYVVSIGVILACITILMIGYS